MNAFEGDQEKRRGGGGGGDKIIGEATKFPRVDVVGSGLGSIDLQRCANGVVVQVELGL